MTLDSMTITKPRYRRYRTLTRAPRHATCHPTGRPNYVTLPPGRNRADSDTAHSLPMHRGSGTMHVGLPRHVSRTRSRTDSHSLQSLRPAKLMQHAYARSCARTPSGLHLQPRWSALFAQHEHAHASRHAISRNTGRTRNVPREPPHHLTDASDLVVVVTHLAHRSRRGGGGQGHSGPEQGMRLRCIILLRQILRATIRVIVRGSALDAQRTLGGRHQVARVHRARVERRVVMADEYALGSDAKAGPPAAIVIDHGTAADPPLHPQMGREPPRLARPEVRKEDATMRRAEADPRRTPNGASQRVAQANRTTR